MSPEYQVAALWVGGKLSFLEELCLKSFVHAGQHVILFTYEKVENVPEGVEVRAGSDILPNPKIIRHGRTGSPAPFSDLFRYRMLAQMDRTIWVDTDAYCCRPFTPTDGHFYAFGRAREVNNGVLALPQDSETLLGLIELTNNEFAIPQWLPEDTKAAYEDAAARGEAISSGDMAWGIWGPQALTHFLQKTGEIKHALAPSSLYPISYADRALLTRPGVRYAEHVTDDTYSIHFYGRRVRARISEKFGGLPRPRSLLGQLLQKHGIDPALNPLPDLSSLVTAGPPDEELG